MQSKMRLSRHSWVGNGYTIIEILVVAGLLSIFSMAVFRFYTQSNKSQTMLFEGLQMQSSLVTGVNRALREIRHGTEFVVPGLSEPSPILVFKDFENNIVALFPLLNDKYTEEEQTGIYDLYCYRSMTKVLNIGAPVHDPGKLSMLCSNVKDIRFKLSSANSVTMTLEFHKGGKTFQTISEGALMNAGDVQ